MISTHFSGSFSTIVPVTMMSAPAFTAAFAFSGVLIPPPTMSVRFFFTLAAYRMNMGGIGSGAPDPASRYAYFIPIILAASTYAAPISGRSYGIVLAFPTYPAAPPYPTIM